jgi:hypothetical protein
MRNIQALLFLSNASMKGICLRCILHASLAVQNCDHNDILIPSTRYTRRETTLRSRKCTTVRIPKRSNLYLSDYLICGFIWRMFLVIPAIRQFLMRYLRIVSG